MGQARTLVTAEQLPEIARDRRVELVRGEVVEMSPVGKKHARIVARFLSLLDRFVAERKLGAVGTEAGFILARDPDVVRAPDVHFVARDKMGSPDEDGFYSGAPDLAAEVVSPDDRASAVQEKIREYIEAGSRLVLLVDPQSKTVMAYHPSGEAHVYSGNEPVPGDPVLPGFSFCLADLFNLD